MKLIPVGTENAIVDDEDFDWLRHFSWRPLKREHTSYAVTQVRIGAGRKKTVHMHRLIMAYPDGLEVDHINGRGLDNRRRNLRKATRSENCRNRRHKSGGTSRFLGVCAHSANRWRAAICCDGSREDLGLFKTEEEAARAYDAAAKRLFGEFASLNFACIETELNQEAA